MRQAILTFVFIVAAIGAEAQEFRALARVLPGESQAVDAGGAVAVTLALTQSVPYRVALYDAPRRVIIEAREVDWSGMGAGFAATPALEGIRITPLAETTPGWTRLELVLTAPHTIDAAYMETDPSTGAARIELRLVPTSAEAFAAQAEAAPDRVANPMASRDDGLVVALDPGHGGVDPGAEADGLREADLMLTFAWELAEALVRTGEADVVLTREDDIFVSLPERISVARAAGADVFVSLHADALTMGRASGATVYTLSEEASDAASASLAEQFDRTDLLQGVDLTATDDQVAEVLMDLTRRDTAPRAAALADDIVAAFSAAGIPLHPQPRLQAGFSVLKAADIPSILLEVGFLSNPRDLERIRDAGWREDMQAALVRAILDWAEADRVAAGLRLR